MRNKPYPIYDGIYLKEDFFSILSYCRDQYVSRDAVSFRKNKAIEKKSFVQLLTDSLKLASYIAGMGWKGQNIAIVSPNSYEWIITFFAIQFCGNIAVPINCNLPAEDRKALLVKAGISAAFVSRSVTISQDTCTIYDIDSILDTICEIDMYPEVSVSNAPSMIFFTSGSTGHHKGAMLSQQNICFDVFCMTKLCNPYESKTALQTLPFYHTLGLSTFIFYLLNGLESFIERSPRHVLKDLKEISPAVTTWVPAITEGIYNNILHAIDTPSKKFRYGFMKVLCHILLFAGIDVRSKVFRQIHHELGNHLQFICCGGAFLPEKVVREFRTWGIYIMTGYGITECSPVISVCRNYHWRDGSVGLVLPDISVNISSDGEILVKGKNVFSGYYGDKQNTQDVFTSDGWFKTGDTGYLDKDGFLYITGRKKNIIILSSGENISPEELEEKMHAFFPGIKEVIVFQEGDRIIAEVFVENNAYQTEISSKLTAFNRTLDTTKHIHELRFRAHPFPKTNGGKIKRTYNVTIQPRS